MKLAINPSSKDTSKKKINKPKFVFLLSTITAVFIALTALVINIDKFVKSLNDLLNSVGLTGDVCTSIDCEVTIFQEIPFILNQTLKDRYYKRKRDYFWVLVKAENKCWWKKARVDVRFNLRKGIEFIEKASLMNEKVEFQLDNGESKIDTVDPELKLNTPDLEGEIDVKWEVFVDGHTEEIGGGHHPVKVLSRRTFPWGWKRPLGDAVDEKFVLSSLSVWASDPDSYVERLAKEISTQTNVSLPNDTELEEIAEKWIEKCIKKLFVNPKWGQNNLNLIYENRDFPVRRKIQLPRSILRDQDETPKRDKDEQRVEIDRLETGLLIAALSKKEFERRGIKRFLIVNPFLKKNKVDYFFAWLCSEDKFYAILLDQNLSESNFHNNVASATNVIKDLFRSNSSIRQELKNSGIYFEKSTSLLAIDFQNSMKKYSISEVR